MALYTIGDTHLALGCNKPMDVFNGWQDYVQRLKANWQRRITPQDTVVVAGDISWAMSLPEALEDFAFLHHLPGNKILMKGNHDFWWTTMAKMQRFVSENRLDTLHFLHNNSYEAEGVSLCGTRGWLYDTQVQQDVKVMDREAGRLRASLEAAACNQKIVFLHYPPLYTGASAPKLIEIMHQFGVKQCYYGHLHGASIRWAVQGTVDGIHYKLVSADNLAFAPLLVQADKIHVEIN